ncbi:MAG TPA: CRISPR-associated protein Cas4 [Rectinemataceae bacterium]|nr:CRISPR-associated protein Cas4 [Rectinemataceae bacterium]
MLDEDEDPIPISALQHALFCERQYALIHIEQAWAENRYTAEGKILHERVDVVRHESRRLFRQEYGLALRSLRLGLIGKCDLVELRLEPNGSIAEAVPVEFKRGKKKEDDVDLVQLCAQALCLEEMFGIAVPQGEFYYLQEHRRREAAIDEALRERTVALIGRIRELREAGKTPPAVYDRRKCDSCSLVETCMPRSAGGGERRVDRYVASQLRAIKAGEEA